MNEILLTFTRPSKKRKKKNKLRRANRCVCSGSVCNHKVFDDFGRFQTVEEKNKKKTMMEEKKKKKLMMEEIKKTKKKKKEEKKKLEENAPPPKVLPLP